MQTMKRNEAYARAIKVFGPWNAWKREHHLAYGLIRGISYSKMEKCCNDNPLAVPVEYALWALGAWPENVKPNDGKFHCIPIEYCKETWGLIQWVKKPVRGPKIRSANKPQQQEAAQ
jgi:hypothetical protein